MRQAACPLCGGQSTFFYSWRQLEYLRCSECLGLFLHPDLLPEPEAERARYLEHNNDVEDPGYRAFVAPLTSAIRTDFGPEHQGLDFGAGTGPVSSRVLEEDGYRIVQYDPFFDPHPELLERQYDYIACCEVMEHFHHPFREFRLLRRLLKPGGRLYCKTSLFAESIDFGKWRYKDDFTHVFFYHPRSLEWIAEHCCFGGLDIRDGVLVFGG